MVPVDGDGHEESPAWQISEMKRLAERSGLLPAEALEVYERLVGAVEVTAQDAKKITSREMLDLLIDAKLVERSHTSDNALYFAVGPDLGLLTLMALSGRTAAEALDGLSDAMRSLGSIPAAALRMYAGRTSITGDRNDTGPSRSNFRESLGLELITERHRILELTGYGGLSSEAQHELCSVETAVMEAHFTEVTVREPTPLMQDAGVRSRTLCEHAFLEHEPLRNGLATCIKAGEEARILSDTPATKMKIVDGHTALVALTSTGANEALLVRNKFLAGALQHYFDLMWDGATPLEISSKGRVVERAIPKADGLSAREQRIVRGLKNNKTLDEIAHEVKISVHTVSRTVEKIMARLGVEGRVALGAECQKLGYFDEKKGPDKA